jgi:autotransporter-associated beta strand protein
MLLAATRIPSQLTGHVISGGETMSLDFWHIGKSGWQAGDTIAAELFHLDDEGAVQVLAAATFQPQVDVWQQSTHEFPAIDDPAAIGKPLGIRFRSNAAAGRFASIDDIILATGFTGGVTLDWSGANAWIDAATGAAYSLLAADSFAGTRLEFPVTGGFSYTATNPMTRMSDLEFMLNEMRLSGVFDGTAPQSATVDGNELLLTNDLSANPPAIHIAADGPDFLFRIATDLILYHDLEIRGDGTATVEITGTIRDYHDSRGVTKNGSSIVRLAGTHSYSGPTTIADGGIILDDGASLANTDVLIQAGLLGGNGTIGGDVSGPGHVKPGRSTGTLSVDGNASPGFLHIDIDGGASDRFDVAGTLDLTGTTLVISDLGGGFTEPAYVIASYGALTGTFAAVTALPEGYVIDYAHDDGAAANHVALVRDGYAAWISGSGVAAQDAGFTADANKDGIANGLAFFLGAPDANQNAAPFLPTGTLAGDNLVFSFDRVDAASILACIIQYGPDLDDWSEALDGVDGISIDINHNGPAARFTATIPTSLVPATRMFVRLKVMEPPPTGNEKP